MSMNIYTERHTPLDAAALDLAGIDPNSTEPRHRAVPCDYCRRPTLNLARCCDTHWEPPGQVVRRAIDLR